MHDADRLQHLCDEGQARLERTDYLGAIAVLEQADLLATRLQDFDTLARLCLPLQEARRQARQRCGEGIVRLDLVEPSAGKLDPLELAARHPHGQLLLAAEGSLAAAVRLRTIQRQRMQYAETFLAASYPLHGSLAVLVVPTATVQVPSVGQVRSVDDLLRRAPANAVVLTESELPRGQEPGNSRSFAWTMALWERLHLPYLALAKSVSDLRRRMAACRDAIAVDPACEAAHQLLSEAARELSRQRRE